MQPSEREHRTDRQSGLSNEADDPPGLELRDLAYASMRLAQPASVPSSLIPPTRWIESASKPFGNRRLSTE